MKFFFTYLTLAFLLTSCQMTKYILESGYEQAKILKNRIPLEEVISNKGIDENIRKKLKLILKVREFAENELKLKVGKNYNTYVDLKRPYVSYALNASPKFELKHYKWNYPLVGSLPYKGFFTLEKAHAEADIMKGKDFDTYVRGVRAYSTLGWFDDPVLSSMMKYKDYDLVNLIIHESVHATIYIKGHADFNERLASYIGNIGTAKYYEKLGLEGKEVLALVQLQNEDEKIFSNFISKELKELKNWYKDNKNSLNDDAKKSRLKEIQNRFKENIVHQLKTESYKGFSKIELNNARLLIYKTYVEDLKDFERMGKHFSYDFYKILDYCKTLEDQDDPAKVLSDFTKALS